MEGWLTCLPSGMAAMSLLRVMATVTGGGICSKEEVSGTEGLKRSSN